MNTVYLIRHSNPMKVNNTFNKDNLQLQNEKSSLSIEGEQIAKDKLNKKYDFIYSVAVIHMFLKEEHRNLFYKFIYEHLNDNGIALVISMGDGTSTYKSNIDDAFKKVVRKNINTNKEIMVTSTSCNIVDFATFKEEIIRNNLKWLCVKIRKVIGKEWLVQMI